MKGASARLEVAPPAAALPAAAERTRIAVCVATCRRPHGLRRLLESLAALDPVPGADPFVVIVDNDAAESGRAALHAVREAGFPLAVHYDVEPERNIARARNRSVAIAREHGADWLAFVDDDEVVVPGWLAALCAAADRYHGEVISGAKRPQCPEGTPAWLVRGHFYGQNEQRTGVELDVAHTGNALVATRVLAALPEPFDPRFGLTGGSDSHLFMRLNRHGVRIVSAGDALTFEHIPATRARPQWVLRRAFRVGNTAILCERGMPPGEGRLWSRLAKATARLALGVAGLPLALLRGRGAGMDAAWNIVYGLGAWAGLFGFRYLEYSRVHGE